MPNKFMLKRSRELRQRMTLSEKILWQFLRSSSFAGLRFRRQHPIGRYIVDFCCLRKKLIIELDGRYHNATTQEDKDRDIFLKNRGFRILRFTNDQVFDQIDGLLQTIADELTIDWQKGYHDCVSDVKYPQRLYALLSGVRKNRGKIESKADSVFV